MKPRYQLFASGFLVVYFLVLFAMDAPNLVNGSSRYLYMRPTPQNFLVRLFDMGIFFLFSLVPYIMLQRYYPRRLALAIACIAATGVALFFFHYMVLAARETKGFRLRGFFIGQLFPVTVYILYGIVFFFIRYAQHKELAQKELEIQNRRSELSFLRSQINPHFLFNSLHNIYALVYEKSPASLDAILRLSDLLRYMLYEQADKVPLQRELSYISQLIELQKLRYEHAVHVHMQVSGDAGNVQVPPLLLIPFIENAFKHGDLQQDEPGINVVVHAGIKTLSFVCTNKTGTGKKDAGHGIGLDNVRRRLEILYPQRHTLEITQQQGIFTIQLELQHAT